MRLKDARKRRNITQEEIAKHAGISLRYYQQIEGGSSLPTATIALSIAKCYGISPYKIDEWYDVSTNLKGAGIDHGID